jgi:hypothetical protein
VFGYIDDLVAGIIGHEGRKFFPFVFTLFLFILAMNVLGLFLVFTATSQLAVTASLAVDDHAAGDRLRRAAQRREHVQAVRAGRHPLVHADPGRRRSRSSPSSCAR